MGISLGLANLSCLLGVGLAYVALAAPVATWNNGIGPVKTFTMDLTWEDIAPDGFTRKMILTNGQFPGPTLNLDQGDLVEVTVNNLMPFNTTLHFHGIEQTGTPWSDGTPGMAQRQIMPGQSFIYKWIATQYGTYWWHSHQGGQIDDGMFGAIIIAPTPGQPKPWHFISKSPATVAALDAAERSKIPVILSDHRHITSIEALALEEASGIDLACYDSILVNGKGQTRCWTEEEITPLVSAAQLPFLAAVNGSMTAKGCLPPAGIAAVQSPFDESNASVLPPNIFFTCNATEAPSEIINVTLPANGRETWVGIDFITTFGFIDAAWSFDNHSMWVYAIDGAYIEPQLVQAIDSFMGKRFAVFLQVDTVGDYTLRVSSTSGAQFMQGFATLRVTKEDGRSTSASPDATGSGAGTSSTNTTAPVDVYINSVGTNTTADVVFLDMTSARPFPPSSPARVVDQTFHLGMKLTTEAGYLWAMNDSAFPNAMVNSPKPLLYYPEPAQINNWTISTRYGTWNDIIIQTTEMPQPPHAIHKHGVKMYLLGQGLGTFNWSTVEEAAKELPPGTFNFEDPPMCDTFETLAAAGMESWTAVRWHSTNPGVWAFHCHVVDHEMGGMTLPIQEGLDAYPPIPEYYWQFQDHGGVIPTRD